MPKTTTGSTSIRLHGSTPGHIVKISEAGHLESVDLETHEDFTALKDTVDAKQATITNTTNLSINELSAGNSPITPGNSVVYPLQIRQPFLSSPNPQNGFGVGMKIRYPRGGGSTDVVDMASIESYFKSDGNTQTPFTGLRFDAMDGGTTRPLFNVYHTSPQGDGESTMEIGVGAAGTLKAQNIELNGTSLATTLTGKQNTITNAMDLNVRSITFDNTQASGNCILSGNAILKSGNDAYIQNGNIYNFTSLQNSLLTNVTLGNNWKYQNGSGYPVVNASNNNILEYINASVGSHNWYSAGNTAVVMAWQPQNDRLFLSGDVLADKFLHNVSGVVVRGYGFFRFEGTSGSINMNTTTGIDVPWTNVHVDGQTFTPNNTQITVINTGFYEVGFNIYLTSTLQRPNPTLRLMVNGNDTGYLAWSYIRSSSNHNENSWSLSPVMLSLTAGDILSVQGRYTTNGITGGTYLYNNTNPTNRAYPTLMIKRIA